MDTSPVFSGHGRDARALDEAASVLRAGGLVVFPTETVYGLGAAAFDVRAVARVFEVKGRPRFDPLIVHVAEPAGLDAVAAAPPPAACALAEKFWPGPLTLVLPKLDRVPYLVTAGLASVAVRVPAHPLARALIERVGQPLAAPSANRFGGVSPTTVAAARAELAGVVDIFLDGGPCAVGVESTVLAFPAAGPILLRPGGLPVEELEAVIGRVRIADDAEKAGGASPGCLPRHYAPRTPLRLWTPPVPPPDAGRSVLLTPFPVATADAFAQAVTLAPDHDPRAAAAGLFAALRALDALGAPLIYACLAPETGLGRAINDRLRRAASHL